MAEDQTLTFAVKTTGVDEALADLESLAEYGTLLQTRRDPWLIASAAIGIANTVLLAALMLAK